VCPVQNALYLLFLSVVCHKLTFDNYFPHQTKKELPFALLYTTHEDEMGGGGVAQLHALTTALNKGGVVSLTLLWAL
jgi:hypothetical protein